MSLYLLNLTLPTAAENLALDEAILEEAEAADSPVETLRLWESRRPIVVVGRSSRIDREVRTQVCRELDIPVLRRISGGAAIVAGPGCLMYGLVLSYRLRPRLRVLDELHRYVLNALGAAIRPFASDVEHCGTSDLAVGGRKISGNSVRCRRNHFLYHGTLLYDFPPALIERCLAIPPRMPDYRNGRPHAGFVTNLPVGVESLRASVAAAFDAREPLADWPVGRVVQLVADKYARPDWNNNGVAFSLDSGEG